MEPKSTSLLISNTWFLRAHCWGMIFLSWNDTRFHRHLLCIILSDVMSHDICSRMLGVLSEFLFPCWPQIVCLSGIWRKHFGFLPSFSEGEKSPRETWAGRSPRSLRSKWETEGNSEKKSDGRSGIGAKNEREGIFIPNTVATAFYRPERSNIRHSCVLSISRVTEVDLWRILRARNRHFSHIAQRRLSGFPLWGK